MWVTGGTYSFTKTGSFLCEESSELQTGGSQFKLLDTAKLVGEDCYAASIRH